MKNLFKYIGLTAVLLFSFYYTEKMSNIVINNSSLVTEINENSNRYKVEAVSAIIEDDYIVPGLNGYSVNVLKSYDNMRHLDTFNSYYLAYDKVSPNVSLENNKDKIIKYGNKKKNAVAIIIKDNMDIINYSKEKKIEITRLVDTDTYDKNAYYEQINNDLEEYKKVEKMLNNSNINKNICVINNNIIDICRDNKKYLVEASTILNNYNLATIKDSISSGYIFYINDNVSVTDYKILIRQIYYQDLNIVSLSSLITEERD
ncbi:MAG: hypothetical protein E7161_01390 [Firmicutes bacterium]|nr:hypothetical protein [Bacillota bacterium]